MIHFPRIYQIDRLSPWRGGASLSHSLIVKSVNVHNFLFKVNKSHSTITISEKRRAWQWCRVTNHDCLTLILMESSFAPHKADWVILDSQAQWGMDYVNIDSCLVIYHSLIMTMLACHYYKRNVKKIISNSLCCWSVCNLNIHLHWNHHHFIS